MRYGLLILLLVLSSCNSQKSIDNLMIPVLNIAEDNYPTRKIDIHDIADVEYIALESSDSTLIGKWYIYISDKYVVTSDGTSGGNIYFFNLSGKLLWKYNKRGSGPGEFSYLGLDIVDFDEEECYINDINKKMLYVYSFKGDYKYTISLQGLGKDLDSFADFSVLNYNKNYLLGYDFGAVLFNRELPDRPPYFLINKHDGSRHPLDLKIRNGLTNQIYDGKGEYMGALSHSSLLQNGNECWITELSSDTIFSLVNKKLVPVAVQNPSVHSTTSPLAIFPSGFNDYFFVFDSAPLSADDRYPNMPKNSRTLVWNRLTNQLEQWELYNSDIISPHNLNIPVMANATTMKNCGMLYYDPEWLINCSKKGILKNELAELAPKLREDDNNIIVLVKYNKEKIWKFLAE